MNLFNRKPAEPAPEDITGTTALREMLQARARKWPLPNIARDVNDGLVATSQRTAARDMASRMTGGATDDSVVASIARGLASNMPDTVGRNAGISATELEHFMAGETDLSLEVKTQLAKLLYNDNVSFDPVADKLFDGGSSIKLGPRPITPEPWRSPDPAIAAAQDALKAAYRAAQPPEPVRKPLTPEQMRPSWPPKRAGFA